MSRETALEQLNEIRQEIVGIHDAFYECKYYGEKVQKLQDEKDNPSKPKASLKPENTAEQLKNRFLAENTKHYVDDQPGILNVKIYHAILQVLILALMAYDGFTDFGIINVDANALSVCLVFHILLEAGIVVMFFAHESIIDFIFDSGVFRVGVCGYVAFQIVVLDILAFSTTKAWIYLIFTVLAAVISLIAIGIVSIVNNIKAKKPKMTSRQKQEYNIACQNDELAKEENVTIRANAKAEWEKKRAERLPELEREINENVDMFNKFFEKANIHMERLSGMDALCEEEKNLQVVDMLIRFIETRRADSIKEALQEYDKLMANQQLLEIEKKKLEAEMVRMKQERASQEKMLEEQRQHQSEMEYWARNTASNTSKMLEEQRHHQSQMEYWARDNARTRKSQLQELQQISNMVYYDYHAHN